MRDDTISRAAAIESVCTMLKNCFNASEEILESVKITVGELPSAQRWIPCGERLPDVREWVLCQCRAGIMDVLRLTDDNDWYKDSTHIYMHSFVLAWMPLPESYIQEGDRDNVHKPD